MDTFGTPIELTIYNQKTNTVSRKTVNIKKADKVDLAKAYRKTPSSSNTAVTVYENRLPAYLLALEPKGLVDYLLNVNLATATGLIELADAEIKKALTAVGTTRADALALTATYNRVSTAASGTGVILKALAPFSLAIIFNDGANAIKVYAPSTDYIDAVAGATGITLAAGAVGYYITDKNAVTNVAGKGWKTIAG